MLWALAGMSGLSKGKSEGLDRGNAGQCKGQGKQGRARHGLRGPTIIPWKATVAAPCVLLPLDALSIAACKLDRSVAPSLLSGPHLARFQPLPPDALSIPLDELHIPFGWRLLQNDPHLACFQLFSQP